MRINPHLKSYVCIHVFEHSRPVLLVSRVDGDWCFLCGDLHPQDASAYRVVGIDWEAERAAKGAPWIRTALRPN